MTRGRAHTTSCTPVRTAHAATGAMHAAEDLSALPEDANLAPATAISIATTDWKYWTGTSTTG